MQGVGFCDNVCESAPPVGLPSLQVLRVLLDRLGKVPQPLMHIAEGDVDDRSGARHPSPCGGCCRPGAVKASSDN